MTPQVLDTNSKYAYITEGLSLGDLIVLSPVEESRLGGPLKVLDINDTTNVLVDPPKPKWLIAKEAASDAEKTDGKNKTRGKQDEGGEKPKKKSDSSPSESGAVAGDE